MASVLHVCNLPGIPVTTDRIIGEQLTGRQMAIAKVLLVDDDGDLRRIGELSLRNVGKWTVFLASSGNEAIKMASQGQPDLILLDVMMPEMDGPMTLRKLRTSPATANIPVIFLTAKMHELELQEYMQMGAAGVIVKPFDPMTLPDQIKGMLRQKS